MATWAGIAALLYMALDDELPNRPPVVWGRPIPKLVLGFMGPEKAFAAPKVLALGGLYRAPPAAPNVDAPV